MPEVPLKCPCIWCIWVFQLCEGNLKTPKINSIRSLLLSYEATCLCFFGTLLDERQEDEKLHTTKHAGLPTCAEYLPSMVIQHVLSSDWHSGPKPFGILRVNICCRSLPAGNDVENLHQSSPLLDPFAHQ